jgi:hypothetical protein
MEDTTIQSTDQVRIRNEDETTDDHRDDRGTDPFRTSQAVAAIVNDNDPIAYRELMKHIEWMSYRVPPYDGGDEKRSAASVHLSNAILRKVKQVLPQVDAFDQVPPDVIASMAADDTFAPVLYEVKLRLIDDARRASAKKRGGDGDHVPRFDTLGFDGEVESARELEHAGASDNVPSRRRPIGSRIEHQTRELWLRFSEPIWRRQVATDPDLSRELGPAAILFRFYLDQPDADCWTQGEIAEELGVTDRTVRNYRQAIARLVTTRSGRG